MDVVKLKIQTQNALPVEERQYKSLPDCYRTIYREVSVGGGESRRGTKWEKESGRGKF